MMKKLLLVNPNLSNSKGVKHPRQSSPPYTLKHIESNFYDSNQVDIKLVDAMAENLSVEDVLKESLEWKPDFIVFLVNPIKMNTAYYMMNELKRNQNPLIIAVGSIEQEFLSEKIDVYVPGEGEVEVSRIILSLITKESSREEVIKQYKLNLERKTLKNFTVEDLDSLSQPRYTKTDLKKNNLIYPIRTSKKLVWGHILSSRGCPFKCVFCSPSTRESYGLKIRLRSPEGIIREIKYFKSLGANIINFDDDLFTLSKSHVKDVCTAIIQNKLNIKWIAHSRVDTVDFEMLKLMKEAGCALLRFGIESGSTRIVDLLSKKESDYDWGDKVQSVFKMTKKLKIATYALIIIGSPTETEEDIQETVNLVQKINPDALQIHFFNPYPGSRSFKDFKQHITKDSINNMHHYSSPNFQISKVDVKRLEVIRSQFYRKIMLNPRFFFKHLVNYSFFYVRNLDVALKLSRGFLSIS